MKQWSFFKLDFWSAWLTTAIFITAETKKEKANTYNKYRDFTQKQRIFPSQL